MAESSAETLERGTSVTFNRSLPFRIAIYRKILQPHLWRSVHQSWRENDVQRYMDEAPTGEQLAQKLYADVKTTLVSEMLTKVDRMTMAHGLEARVPFLDHHLVRWAFTVPGVHKLSNGSGKRLLKEAMVRDLPHGDPASS